MYYYLLIEFVFYVSEPGRKDDRNPYILTTVKYNQTDIRNTSSVTHSSGTGHDIEAYLIPTIMSCPLFVTLYIIYKLWLKLKRMNRENSLNTPLYRMPSLETDL